MTEDRKEELRKSFAGKAVSEMNYEERQVFDADFQYGLSTTSNSEPSKAPCLVLGNKSLNL